MIIRNSTLPRLPVPVRRFHGEDVISYARRAAQANHLEVREVLLALRSYGVSLTHGRDSENGRQVWRELGGLHPTAFTEREFVGAAEVEIRQLCVRCCAGQRAVGRLPEQGMVCRRHRRWLGDSQTDVSALPELLRAERVFSYGPALCGLIVGSDDFSLAQEAAACIPEEMVQERRLRLGVEDVSSRLLTYPEAVKLVCLLINSAFLDSVLTRAPTEDRYRNTRKAVLATISDRDGLDTWRVVDRIWNRVRYEYELLTSARVNRTMLDFRVASLAPFWANHPPLSGD